jgi:DNA-damage-inducible protein J
MSVTATYVRAKIDPKTKKRATEALHSMGLSMSDAIRLLMLRISEERRLPFEIKVPNSITKKAMDELEAGKGTTVSNVKELMASLYEKD